MAIQPTELMGTSKAVPVIATAAENVLAAASEHAGPEKLLKFKKGEYFQSLESVPLGTEFIAHPEAWTKGWFKFSENTVVDRRLYRVARGEVPAKRDELGDLDKSAWAIGLDGKPQDPWQEQYLLPLENPRSGEVFVFATGSYGGKRAASDLCSAWAKRESRGYRGQPIVQLQSGVMPTKKFGKVRCPEFKIVGWTDIAGAFEEPPPFDSPPPVDSETAFDDAIPF